MRSSVFVRKSSDFELLHKIINQANDALDSESPLIAVSTLDKALHFAVARGITINDMPELNKILERTKRAWIVSMLTGIADIKSNSPTYFIRRNVNDLIGVGLNWPELPIIKKSIDLLHKNQQEQDGLLENKLNANATLRAIVIAMKESLAHKKINPNTNVFPLNYLPKISRMLNDDLLSKSEIVSELDTVKYQIIEYMLTTIKLEGRISWDILHWIRELNDLGVTWPEMNVIQKSSSATYHNEVKAFNALREDLDDDFENEYDVKQLLVKIQAELGYDYYKQQKLVINAARNGNLDKLAEKYKNEILIKIEEYLSYHGKYAVLKGISTATSLYLIKCKWPELITLLNKYKKNIIKQVLMIIKENSDTIYVDLLKRFNLGWPELDIMSKSLSVDAKTRRVKAINEGEIDNKLSDLQNIDKLGTKQAIDAAMKLLIHDVKQEVPNTLRYVLQQLIHSYIPKEAIRQAFEENKNWVLYDIRGSITREFGRNYYSMSVTFAQIKRLQEIGIDWPEIRKFIDDRKALIIKYILNIIATAPTYEITEACLCVLYLKKLGYNWPELDVIKNSLKIDNPELLTENNVSNFNRNPAAVLRDLEDTLSGDYDNCSENDVCIDIGEYFKQLTRMNTKLYPELVDKLNENKELCLDALRVIVVDRLIQTFNGICTWLKSNNIEWDELRLEYFKKVIIRSMLVSIKNGFYNNTEIEIEYLHKLSIYWPELETIQASIKFEKSKEQDIDESNKGDLHVNK